jgi:hypothetical protein
MFAHLERENAFLVAIWLLQPGTVVERLGCRKAAMRRNPRDQEAAGGVPSDDEGD